MSVMTSEEHGNNEVLVMLFCVGAALVGFWLFFDSLTSGGMNCTPGEMRVVDGEVQVCKAPTYWVEEGDGR